jgi:hypothetical protein
VAGTALGAASGTLERQRYDPELFVKGVME